MRAIGAAGLLAMYNYGGYNNVCNIGEEIRDAGEDASARDCAVDRHRRHALHGDEHGDPRNDAVARGSADPHDRLDVHRADVHGSDAGRMAAIVMTALILFVTASSLYAVILGYSRIPFAAARDGQFFRVFARLHATKHFPHVSLLTIGAVTMPFCFFTLGQIVNW